MKIFRGACVFCGFVSLVLSMPAQTFTTLHTFQVKDGSYPDAALVQGANGNFYGTTLSGGANAGSTNGFGTIFKITPTGALTTLYSFCPQSGCTDGANPYGLIQATDGNFYGTTEGGGVNGGGTVFKITAGGVLTTLYNFCPQSGCTDGANPYAGLIQATNGDFYGTTANGGAKNDGTVFKITPNGTLTTLHSFVSTDGANPYGGLVQATGGNLYGTTESGGANNKGTVFEITPNGTLTSLYSFCSQSGCKDGALPSASLIQAADGNFYGTTYFGGINATGCDARGCGTVFKIAPSGTLTTLHRFCSESGCSDGNAPSAALIQATSGEFYGTTAYGGGNSYGTVFKITAIGTLTTLHSFSFDSTDGDDLFAGLVQATDGKFYGTTFEGGGGYSRCFFGCGTIFSLSVGLGPFVETQPTSGRAGAAVKILGTNLTGATSVTFDGTAAVFKVASASLITTTVPTGAATGFVTVTTPSGTLTSNVRFRVKP